MGLDAGEPPVEHIDPGIDAIERAFDASHGVAHRRAAVWPDLFGRDRQRRLEPLGEAICRRRDLGESAEHGNACRTDEDGVSDIHDMTPFRDRGALTAASIASSRDVTPVRSTGAALTEIGADGGTWAKLDASVR